MRSEIIFIGPVGAGKTTLGTLVAEALQLPKHSLDDLRWGYYDEIGYDVATMKASDAKEGFAGVYQYWKPFEIHAVERMLEEHKDCVFDFGAGHSVYANDGLFARAERALAPFSNVVLILPSPDLEESLCLLQEVPRNRQLAKEHPDLHEKLQRHLVTHHSNHDLAKHVVYTHGKSPEQSRDELLEAVSAT